MDEESSSYAHELLIDSLELIYELKIAGQNLMDLNEDKCMISCSDE